MKSKTAKSVFVRFFLFGVLVLFNGHFTKAQNLASINGRVQDASGAAIPDTTVTVTSSETATTRTATSDDQGDYRVLSLPVGAYEIKAEKNGFKTRLQSGVQLTVGQTAVVNLIMEVGQVQQQVTVTADVPVVNTSTVSTAGLVQEQQIKDLPLNGRSFDNLITLNAGAANITSSKTAGAGAPLGNLFSISGRQYFQNIFLMNGVDYSGPNQTHSVPGNVSGQLLGIDAVREFNVQSNAYDAQYGQRSGGQINIVSMSGTNALHGSVFEFIRNSALDARNFFDHPQGERIPPFKRNQFGGSLGGPIRKDKTFLFGNYEGFRQILNISDAPTVPSLNARNGFTDVAPVNGVCAQGPLYTGSLGPNTGLLPFLDAFYPVPNGACLGSGSASGFYNPPSKTREDFGIVRLDQNISTKDTLSVSHLFDDGFSEVPQLDPIFAVDTALRAQVFSASETHIFSPNLINVVTFGYSLNHWHFTTPSLSPIPASLDLVAGQYIGRFAIGGTGGLNSGSISSGGGGKGINSQTHTSRTTYADTVSLSRGRHQFMAGIWLMPLYSNETAPVESGGFPSFTGLPQLESNQVSSFGYAPTVTPMHWKQLEGAWFAQDIIQVKPNFTLRLGLRHEFTNGWTSKDGNATTFVIDPNGVPETLPVLTKTPFAQNNTKWLFGPRIGLAYDPFGKGKTSIRAGFGIHFDLQDTMGSALDSAAPTNGIVSLGQTSNFSSMLPFPTSAVEPPSCTTVISATCSVYAVSGAPQNFKSPTVDEWNLSVEQSFGANTSLTVGYVGSHMTHGLLLMAPDAIVPLTCANAAGCLAGGNGSGAAKQSTVPQGTLYVPAGGPGIANTLPNKFLANGGTYLAYENNDSYNAMEVGLKHRLSAGLQFQVNYTWSRDEDFKSGYSADNGNDNPAISQAYNPSADWGPTATDKKNKLSVNAQYQLPFGQGKRFAGNASGAMNKLVSGWQLNGIFSATSGFPFGSNIGSNFSGSGDTFSPDRPYWNPTFTGNPIVGSPTQWFNPDAFTLCGPGSTAACTQLQGENDRFYAGNLPLCSAQPGNPSPLTTTTCAASAPVALTGASFGTFGTVGRNVLYGPDLFDLDMSLFKDTKINERVTIEFRAEGFNILNRANFASPGLSIFSSNAPSPTAGNIASTTTTSRQLQFGLKVLF